jgi:23S rRNA pseudouridine2605 synthase
LNAEQLNSARLARWSQNGEARLTLEAASEWLGDIGFCPYMPMGLTGGAPAPSFLEAVVGRPAQAPSVGERSRALELLGRLIENSLVVPLKLGSSLGEQPDFVCSPDVLRYIYALRGDRNFKTGPLTVGNEKVTPLSLHCWQAIEQQGPLDVTALQPILGRDITEAAISRALQELWSGMYIFPVLGAAGKPAQWELMFRRFPKPVAAGASTGHAEAQSAMISLYLQASVAAREEEILAFLSPLAPQSKLREVMRGLGSMRQLDILDIGGRAHVALQGGLLPEMVLQLSEEFLAEPPARAVIEGEAEIEVDAGSRTASGIEIEAVPQSPQRPWRAQPLEDSDGSTASTIRKFVPKKSAPRQTDSPRTATSRFAARGSGEHRGPRPPAGDRSRPRTGGFSRPAGTYTPRPGNFAPRSFAASAEENASESRPRRSGPSRSGPGRSGPSRFGRNRESTPYRRDASGGAGDRSSKPRGAKGYAAKERGMGERAKRWEKSGEVPEGPSSSNQPFAPRSIGYKSFGSKPGGSKFRGAKPFGGKSFGPKPHGSKPWQSKSSAAEGRGERPKPWKKFDAARDSRTDLRDGTRKPYASKSEGFKPRIARPWTKKSDDGESFSRGPRDRGPREAGERPKPWQTSRPGGSDRAGSDQPGGRKPWASKGAGSRIGSAKSYAARSAAKPYAKAGGAKPWAKRSAASAGGEEVGPKRREPKEGPETSPREKSGAKPFWAKNPRGGKGSTAGSRTNRPRGKKAVRKSGKKK